MSSPENRGPGVPESVVKKRFSGPKIGEPSSKNDYWVTGSKKSANHLIHRFTPYSATPGPLLRFYHYLYHYIHIHRASRVYGMFFPNQLFYSATLHHIPHVLLPLHPVPEVPCYPNYLISHQSDWTVGSLIR